MKPKRIQFLFSRVLWAYAGVALAAGSLASCTYTLPTSDDSTGGAGGGGSTGSGSSGLVCNPGWTNCNDECVDLTSDPVHCGGCDEMCGPGLECANSGCKPPPVCMAGAMEACYDGPSGMAGVGLCKNGVRTCLADGMGYGPCMYQVLPATEECGNEWDEDCDGSAPKGASCLTNQGLVVRYLLNEAASGAGPETVMDYAADPLPLTIDYGGAANMSFTEESTGRGLRWNAAGSPGTASAAIDGTKVYDALHGKSQATIEIVAKFDAITGDASRIFHIGMGAEGGRFSLQSFATDRIQFKWNDDVVLGNWPLNFSKSGRCVIHVVLDTARNTPANRVRLFVDGTLVGANLGVEPPHFATIDIGPGRSLYLGNREGLMRSFAGSLYYAALYQRALPEAEVMAHADYLGTNDDQ